MDNIVPARSLIRTRFTSVREPILLITPPSIFLLDERVFTSLGILKVAAVLEKRGHTIEFLDLSGIENFVEVAGIHAFESNSKFAAITITTPQLPAAVKIATKIRSLRPDMRLIVGGPHVTLVHSAVKLEKKSGRIGRAHKALEKLESIFDVLVSGDGEVSIFEAIADNAPKLIDADIPKGGLFMTNEDYEATPYPARHLVDMASYKYSIEGHRATSLVAQLGCPFGCGFSITGDALVFTDNGFESIASLASGAHEVEKCVHGGSVHVHKFDKKVSTLNGSASASSVVYEGKRRVFEVRTKNGFRLRATKEHPLLSLQDGALVWKEVRDLNVGDYLVIKNPDHSWPTENVKLTAPEVSNKFRKPIKYPTELNDDLAWLIGFLIGDGCLFSKPSPVHLCVTDGVRDRLHSLIRDLFNIEFVEYPSNHTKRMTHGYIPSRSARDFFIQSIGINPKDKLHVPGVIARSPKSVVEAFLKGLWDADRYTPNHKDPYLTTISYDLAREVSQLMLMLGQFPTINEIPATPGHQTKYRINNMRWDRIPTSKRLNQYKNGKWRWMKSHDPNFQGVRRETLEKSGFLHPLLKPGCHYVRISSITPGLVEDIYDLRVPGDHNFIANGIVSHNCGGRNTNMLRRIRTRSTHSIVGEIEHLHKTYGYTGFNFFDDELNVNKNMVELMNEISDLQSRLGTGFRLRGFIKSELFNEEQAQAMYRAGFRWVLCGFEAASPRILENINKRATLEDNTRVLEISKKHNLKVKALMSVGHPGESEESIMDVRDWLVAQHPDDFDCTTITTYAGTPYYDEALPHQTIPDVWTYTCKKSGDRLHSYDVDYCEIADYYKGDPTGGYHSYVFTDHLSGDQIVKLRDQVETEVRAKLNIPFNPGAPGVKYDHSMGQGPLPMNILRTSPNAIQRP